MHLVHGQNFQLYPELPPSPWFQGSKGNNSHFQFYNTLSSVLTSHSSRAVDNLVMASNGQNRAASDTNEFEPSSADKKKAKKQSKNASRPNGAKGRQPDPDPLTDTDSNDYEESESEGNMEVVTNLDFDHTLFMLDITHDMKCFWPTEAHV